MLLLSLLVVGAAVALAIGSYSALAGAGPVTSVASAVIGAGDPDDVDVLDAVDGDDVDGDDLDADDGDGGEAKGAQHIAELIEGAFDAEEGSAWVLHEQGIGFGAIFHAYLIAEASGGTMTVEEVLAAAEAEGFGTMFQDLRDEIAALTADGAPRNLGQLVSASHGPEDAGPPEGAGSDAADDAASAGLEKARDKFAAHESDGHGPPETVPAHGRN
jgi:hypothetical protein